MSDHHMTQPDSAVDREAWHLSKSVPLAFVLTLLIQTVVLVSWAATFKAEFLSFRDEALRQFSELRQYVDTKTTDRITSREVNAEMRVKEQQLHAIERRDEQMFDEIRRVSSVTNNRLERIEAKIDKYIENHGKGTTH